eukprot:CAMPEP_0204360224 /NCGR_PEP_ID=MMETSP0469-20131031/37879_1 /ASSEMBLY_ACC=CAM_ASM_000384 /TAXON_ID=2969 /ORGANISM="Oxyrrhis marina" /LENGTH=167 /DNA_ID=CAMNT_0051348405 /DNA_START=113 /DNA_END=616 /DNA_ORIENTATION=-
MSESSWLLVTQGPASSSQRALRVAETQIDGHGGRLKRPRILGAQGMDLPRDARRRGHRPGRPLVNALRGPLDHPGKSRGGKGHGVGGHRRWSLPIHPPLRRDVNRHHAARCPAVRLRVRRAPLLLLLGGRHGAAALGTGVVASLPLVEAVNVEGLLATQTGDVAPSV